MPKKRALTDTDIEKLRPKRDTYDLPDPELVGHYIRVQPSGSKSFYIIARDMNAKQKRQRLGDVLAMTVEEARTKAKESIRAVKSGKSIAAPESFAAVAENWFARVVEKNGHRAKTEVRRYLDIHLLPAMGGREFTSITRSDITRMLDKIETKAGPDAADKSLSHLSKIANWFQSRHDAYVSPIVRGMRRSEAKARDRVLTDDEIRAIWKTAEANGTFGALVRIALLTAQRRDKLATMKWSDVIDGVWTVAAEAREKGNAGELVLPEAAREIIETQPKVPGNPYVFAGRRTGSHFSGYSKAKRQFDAKCGVADWRLHDLRRTARSLMSRAGVDSRHAEQLLGHTIKGVEGIYDRHAYTAEKAEAARKLAGLLALILAPQTDNVLPIRRA